MQENPESAADSPVLVHPLTEADRQVLLGLARDAIVLRVGGGGRSPQEPWSPSEVVARPAASFVTLRHRSHLRGCIGELVAREPLWRSVVNNAERAACQDFRFDPVKPAELAELRIEVSVLGPAVPLGFATPDELLAQLRPGRDGVILRLGETTTTFLPQVWEDLPDKEQFLAHLCRKAGHGSEAWREGDTQVSVYGVEHFSEP